jgi:predicted permease
MIGVRLWRVLRLRWRSLTRPSALDTELDRELAFHVDQLVQEGVDLGLTPEQARIVARRLMGNVASAKAAARDERRLTWLEDFCRDMQYAARQLRSRPLFATIAAGSLAFALSANAAILSALRTTAGSPSTASHANRLVIVRAQSQVDGRERDQTSFAEFHAWKTRAATLESVSASFGGDRDVSADAFGPAIRISTSAVTSGWFDTLGVRPFRGRLFTDGDYQPRQGPEVMLISDLLWRTRYKRDPRIFDEIARVNGRDTRIVGVLPPDFAYQSRLVQAWFPLRFEPQTPIVRRFTVIGLRRPGVSLAETQADVERVSRTIVDQIPKTLDWRPHVVPLVEAERGWATRPLSALELAAALVLLVACANVSGLLLARNVGRQHEFAMRSALGATRGRLVRQVFAESALLSACAGTVAFVAAWPALWVLTAIVSPPLDAARLIVPVNLPLTAGITMALMLVVTLAVGVAPAVACTTGSSWRSRLPCSSSHHTAPRLRVRAVQIVVQIAASMVLLVSAALVVQSVWRLAYRDLGFDQRRLLLFQIRVPGAVPRPALERIQDVLAHLSGVDAVGGVSDWWFTTLIVPKTSLRLDAAAHPSDLRPPALVITPGFFAALGAPLASGREFTASDDASAPWALIVNREAARLLWPSEDPIGKTLTLGDETRSRVVVGVVGDMPLHREDVSATPMVYTSSLQQPPYRLPAIGVGPAGRMTFVVRYRTDGGTVAREAQRRVGSLGLDLPLVFVGEASAVGRLLLEFRNYGVALSVLAIVAFGLALMGLYGVTAHIVAAETRNVAIRAALGAGRRDLLRVVGGDMLVMTTVGIAIGWVGTLALPRLIATKLWGIVSPFPTTASVVGIVAVTIVAAVWIPLRRAVRIDLAVALRAE